jgi:flagellar biosynthesis/type III secretory pathway M-ring protein FliF/YscJ
VAHKKSAAVRVKTSLKKQLTEDVANTVIALVSSAKAGLDPRDVVVSDQGGNKFTTSASNGLNAMGKQKWDAEFALAEELRRKLENLMRQFVPNIQYDGDVNAYPKYEVIFDYRESLNKQVQPGEVGTSSSRTLNTRSSRRPSEEPGVQPNVSRSANLGNSMYYYTEESASNEKSNERTMQNSVLETATKFAPNVANLTISALIQLPYQLRRDEQNNPIQARNELGEPLIDPETRQPMWEKESIPRLAPERLEELKRLIAQAANIPLAQIPEKIEVGQIDWTPPPISPKGGEAPLNYALSLLRQHGTAAITFLFFALAVFIAYRYATRPIPTEVDEQIEPDKITVAITTQAEEDEELVDEEWEKLRAKVVALINDDPKRAAGQVKRWMRKE